MIKNFTKKRVNIFKTIEYQQSVKKYVRNLADTTNILYYLEYIDVSCAINAEEFIQLIGLMIENDKKFENWKEHIDDSKTLAEIKKELSVYQDKFDEINNEMAVNSHINTYVPICEYPSITL